MTPAKVFWKPPNRNQETILAIFGPGSKELIYTGDTAEDKVSMDGFVGIPGDEPLAETGRRQRNTPGRRGQPGISQSAEEDAAGQWFFDAAAGKEEILARRIGRDEIVAIDVCGALADAQEQYFAQKHGGAKQYAQKFISDRRPTERLVLAIPGRFSSQPPRPTGRIRHRRGIYHQGRCRPALLWLLLPQAGWSGP